MHFRRVKVWYKWTAYSLKIAGWILINDIGYLSVIIVLLCLPQFLMLCDKIIEKTTYKTKFYDDSITVEAKEIENVEETKEDNLEAEEKKEE